MGSMFVQSPFVTGPSERNPFPGQSPHLGQLDWIPGLITGILQVAPAAVSAYAAKRAADRAKQAKEKAEEDAAVAKAAEEKAAADAKAAADKAAQDQRLIDQGITPQGTTLPGQGKILGVDPLVLGIGSVAIIGVGTVLWMALK